MFVALDLTDREKKRKAEAEVFKAAGIPGYAVITAEDLPF
jgi:hypothetical protein